MPAMLRSGALALSLVAALSGCARAAPAPRADPDRVTADQLRAHIAILADDGYQGRKPGTAGGERTEAWIVEAFARAGLTPGASGDRWRQPVALVTKEPDGAERRFESANIIGRVAGTDPAGEAVVLTAHWDHLGLCRPEGTPDRICNGADDNASGIAILVEVARRLAAGPPPKRHIYLVATTAEELGLVGARAFAKAPPLPAGRIVAALNLDTAAIAPAGLPVAIIGRGTTPALDAAIDATARRIGRKVDADMEANVMVKRQDGWALAELGVPSVMAGGSFSDMNLLKAYLGGHYHKPSDDLAHLATLDGAAEDATLHVALARALADPSRYPSPRN